jgi:hypothetical protein
VFNGDEQPVSPYYGYYAQHAGSNTTGRSPAWWWKDRQL